MSNRHLAKEGVKQTLKGKVEQLKGSAKETIGALTGNEHLQAEGKVDKAKGAVHEAVGKVEQKIAKKL